MNRKPVLAALLAVALAPAAGATGRFEQLTQCAGGTSSHADQRSCLQRRLASSEKTLTEAQTALFGSLKQTDEEPALQQRARDAAKADRHAFTAYKTSHCAAFAALAFGGNSSGDRRLACLVELNLERAAQLRAMSDELARRPR